MTVSGNGEGSFILLRRDAIQTLCTTGSSSRFWGMSESRAPVGRCGCPGCRELSEAGDSSGQRKAKNVAFRCIVSHSLFAFSSPSRCDVAGPFCFLVKRCILLHHVAFGRMDFRFFIAMEIGRSWTDLATGFSFSRSTGERRAGQTAFFASEHSMIGRRGRVQKAGMLFIPGEMQEGKGLRTGFVQRVWARSAPGLPCVWRHSDPGSVPQTVGTGMCDMRAIDQRGCGRVRSRHLPGGARPKDSLKMVPPLAIRTSDSV